MQRTRRAPKKSVTKSAVSRQVVFISVVLQRDLMLKGSRLWIVRMAVRGIERMRMLRRRNVVSQRIFWKVERLVLRRCNGILGRCGCVVVVGFDGERSGCIVLCVVFL